jgi:hypothetical protein
MRLLLGCRKSLLLLYSCIAFVAVRADTVITKDATMWGTAVSIENKTITFRSGCTGASITVPWDGVLILQFNAECMHGTAHLPTAPLQVCKEDLVHVFKVRVSGRYVYLSKIGMLPGRELRGTPYGKRGVVVIDKSKVESIQPAVICPSTISELALPPRGMCFEPEQWAVNWSSDPVFNNQIFTKGFAINIIFDDPVDEEVAQELTQSFGTALNLWASTLQEHKGELAPELRAYVERSTASSSKYVLYTPPQVVRVSCKEDALLIVHWVTKSRGIFPRGGRYVARAQLQGRTILLNARENNFGYRPDFVNPLADGKVNLISVFVHELGHCLGLLDDTTDPSSVMNPDHVGRMISRTIPPSGADFQRFAESLRQAIQGTAPGFFNVKDCAGLRIPRNNGVSGLETNKATGIGESILRSICKAVFAPSARRSSRVS